jgi:hypothetical protein
LKASYITDGSATVTYLDTARNSGTSPAYDLSLDDPGAGTGTVIYNGPGPADNVTSVGANGSHFNATLSTLGAGSVRSIGYSVDIAASDVGTVVLSSTNAASLTSYSLAPGYEVAGQESLAGTSLTPPRATTVATAGLDLISGSVNQDVAAVFGTGTPLVGLGGQTISVTFDGQTAPEIITTAHDGTYAVLVPTNGAPVGLTVTVAAPTPDTLDNASELNGLFPAARYPAAIR